MGSMAARFRRSVMRGRLSDPLVELVEVGLRMPLCRPTRRCRGRAEQRRRSSLKSWQRAPYLDR